MIHHIKGRLTEKSPTHAVIDAGGVGYFLNISLVTFSKISNEENCTLYTHLSIKEDAHTLYGFAEKSEREIFRKLISVSGVGASTARVMLSSLSSDEITAAIVTGDVFERALGIPADELVAAPINTRVDGIPVVVIPVTVAAVEVDHHVVDEVGHVDIRGEGIVSRLIGDSAIGDRVSLQPIGSGAVDDISRVGI